MNAVSYIIEGCCNALVDELVPVFVKTPSSEQEWLEISKKFETRWNYPHGLDAIDGKHVTIRKPSNASSYYCNYKHAHSIILLAIAGPEYECLYLPMLDLTAELMTQDYPLQIPRSGHNPSIATKTVRDNFKDYFMNEGVADWQWKYC